MPTPQLTLLPDKRPTVIVVGTSVRKSVDVLRFYLQSLAAQELPPNTSLLPIFVADGLVPDAETLLREWTAARGGEVLRGAPLSAMPDFTDVHPDSHQWSGSAMQRVGVAKDHILARARERNADYVWFCDADLICDTTTLASLLALNVSVATAVYWTRWSARGTETRQIHAGPQVWLRHPYELSGAGYTEPEFRERLASRQLTKVAGYGACTLLDRRALGAGVSFAYLSDVPTQGLMGGEDRHFCIRAQKLHLEAWADPWPDVFHIYHLPADLQRAPEYAERLSVPHSKRATLGDLVSVTIQALEPIPWANGGWTAIPAQKLRGRLGQLMLVPELEEALYTIVRGEHADVAVHFPVHYEVPYYQGKRRLMRVTLHDCKPFTVAPVLESEMLVGAQSRGAIRTVDFTARQLAGMKEIANA